MRILFILALAAVSAASQGSSVRIVNASHPASREFQIGDRFEISITGAANQTVSVRTTMNGRTDWGPVIGGTDASGRWSTTGKFEKSDFGDWNEIWTVGRKLANPAIHFAVGAPCLKGGRTMMIAMGLPTTVTCDTAEGQQTFGTPSDDEAFRAPDGRVVPGRIRSNESAEEYHSEIMQSLITGAAHGLKLREPGDEAATLIAKIIGSNALSEAETRNVLSIIRGAFEKPDQIPSAAKDPSETLRLLHRLAEQQPELKQQIAETAAYVEAR